MKGSATMEKGDDWKVLADSVEENDFEDVSISIDYDDHDSETIIITNNEDICFGDVTPLKNLEDKENQ